MNTPFLPKRNRHTAAVVCGLMAGLAPAASVLAQEGGPLAVSEITFEGLGRTNRAYVEDIVGLRAGDSVRPADLDAAVSRLLRTGRFLSARWRDEPQDAGHRIVFRVVERATVTAIRFEGNVQFPASRLAKEVGIAVGDPLDVFAVRGGRDAIREVYRQSGFNDCEVSYDEVAVESTGELVYRIEEGVRIRVRRILFEGNTVFKPRELNLQILTKTSLGIFRAGDFDEDRAESDAAQLQRFYRDHGYLDARVGFRRELGDDGRSLTLVFTISEGVRYQIERIQIEGNAEVSEEAIRAVLSSKVGQPVKQQVIDADVRAVQSKYWELGYIYVAVKADRVFSEQPGLAQIHFAIEEGGQYKVGRIEVRGNARTRDKVVRRALNLYPPDDLLDLNETQEAQDNLRQTQIFDAVRVFPIGDEPDRRDIVIDVQETERSGDVIFGLGVTSNSGVVGTINLDFKNFDLADPPRTWKELWKFRSFHGGGQRLRVELQPGTDVSRFRVDFTEPYFMDKPIRFDLSGFVFVRGRDGYDESRGGVTVSLGKRFETGFLHGWSGEVSLRLERTQVDNVDLFAAREIRDDEGANFLSSVKVSLLRDRTDNFFLPTTGDRLRISYEQFGILGGDFGFGRLISSYTWYKTVKTDRFDRKSVLRLSAEGGTIIGDAPVFERFFAGGTGSLRGFQFRGVGERSGIDNNNIGGDFLVLLGAEYSYPLIAENVRGHVFLDTGTVGSGAYRASIGVGIRIILNLFGPLPLEFNLAAPIGSDSDDETQVFSFLIGTFF
ncbi:MAG: outer membrane protein assembly factor BamA [Phycisphaerae bacterium]